VCLLLRSKSAHKVLMAKRRDDERVMRKPGFLDDQIDLGLGGKVGNVGEAVSGDKLPPWMISVGL
jgi:hypothetical protein